MFDIVNIEKPETVEDALKMLSRNPNLKIIAGGTDVLIRMHNGTISGVELLSLRSIAGLNEIRILDDGTISIGAMATFAEIFRNEIINGHLPVLSEAAVSVGGPQIRNMATIGGNICNGAVSADSATTLLVYDAALKLISNEGTRTVQIRDFYAGPGRVNLLPGEILTEILISKDSYHEATGCYIKHSSRKAMDIAMLGVSVICRAEAGRFSDVRIALGVAAPIPIRCNEAENYAIGRDITAETLKEIGKHAVKSSKARDSWRASKAYREHLIEILVSRALKEAVIRGGGVNIE
ncbi:MAG TPA: xanthine dehydrogenase FAD-binding subunit XdhB [Bacillota bacterium]|nr:xanthine dehydrogenase FAD-binding subunit XdhB [Bacillota bacterium]HOR86540.1 xanthine dehydrogenase FAD-binding subunit XdhB [Bacillota bacterium]